MFLIQTSAIGSDPETFAWPNRHSATCSRGFRLNRTGTDGRTLARLAVYGSGALTDNDVPSGWVGFFCRGNHSRTVPARDGRAADSRTEVYSCCHAMSLR